MVAIDLVGTLVERDDARHAAGLARLMGEFDPSVAKECGRVYSQRYTEYSVGTYRDDPEFYDVLRADLPGLTRASDDDLGDLRRSSLRAFTEAGDCLRFLSARFPVLLATNFVAAWATDICVCEGWTAVFTDRVVSSVVGARKPSERFFEALLASAGVQQAEDLIMIGDAAVNDVYGALRSGARAVWLTRAEVRGSAIRGVRSVRSLSELSRA